MDSSCRVRTRPRTARKTTGGLVAGLALLAAAAPALGQIARDRPPAMTEEEVRASLLGVDLRGTSPTFGMEWRECIDPAGETLYETPGLVQKGRLRITVGGEACFSYADTGYRSESCYSVGRTRNGFIFTGVNGLDTDQSGSVFVTTSVRRGVRSCPPDTDLIG